MRGKSYNVRFAHFLAEKLDQRVEERAAELEKSNEALRAEIIEHERIEQELEQSRELLDEQGLVAALEWQARDFHTRTSIACRFTPTHEDLPIDPECATALFRIFTSNLLCQTTLTQKRGLILRQKGLASYTTSLFVVHC